MDDDRFGHGPARVWKRESPMRKKSLWRRLLMLCRRNWKNVPKGVCPLNATTKCISIVSEYLSPHWPVIRNSWFFFFLLESNFFSCFMTQKKKSDSRKNSSLTSKRKVFISKQKESSNSSLLEDCYFHYKEENRNRPTHPSG